MFSSYKTVLRFVCGVIMAVGALGQPKPGSDTLILINGEKLIGHLKSGSDTTVVFVSDTAGEVKVAWSKVQELHSDAKFAAIPKNAKLKNSEEAAKVAQGTVAVTNQTLELGTAPAPTRTMPIGDVSNVVPQASFDRALHRQGVFEGWQGVAGFGLSVRKATTSSQTYTSSLFLSRTDPSENWLRARNKTTLDFNFVSDRVTDGPDTITVSQVQANAARDYFLSPRRFVFTGATWEHNSAQGLDLMQAYGGGVGFVLIKNERSEWSARAGLGYVHQGFSDSTLNKNIIGSRINQTYTRMFARGIVFSETAGFRPAWNHPNAFVTGFVASVTVPMYRRLSMSVNSFDSYINNPPPFFKKNSFLVTLGINYVLK